MFRIQSVFWPQNRADDSLRAFGSYLKTMAAVELACRSSVRRAPIPGMCGPGAGPIPGDTAAAAV